ncbi:hypothetical protein H2200_001771 [Cladophialophora chaetospira]|uniref:Very long-chain fatty acid transport protein n=1 Tax=Cladophialophora chaetospira TaxID=386627 RepID=A0AA38XMD5_9EURO|nr:hypothetical protein H2200_001771 [Cladophialophora chaetospira]
MISGAIAAFTAATATAAYLDAKLHIKKDLATMRRKRWADRMYTEASKGKKLSLWYFFEAQVLKDSEKECIWSRTGCYTRSQVYQQSCKFANWFLSQGVVPGQWVAVYLQNCPEFMFIWLALWAIGCAPALLNYNLAEESLLHALKLSGSSLLLVDPELASRITAVGDSITGDLGMKVFLLNEKLKSEISALRPDRPDDSYRENIRGEDNQALIYTSGTSGKPKGVPHIVHHGYLYALLGTQGFEVGSNHRWYQCMPLYHGTGGMVAIVCLMDGTPLCIGKGFSVSRFWDEIRASRSTCFTYVGETVRYLLAAPASASDKDHGVTTMFGNGLRPDVWTKFCDRFGVATVVEFFGSSEGVFALRNCSKGDYTAGCVGHHGWLMRQMMRNIYVPVAIDPNSGELLRSSSTNFAKRQPYEMGGEILVRVASENAFPGYWQDHAATSKKYARDVFDKGDLWYRTGDALRRTEDGRWFFLDRLGDTYRWKSENVSTAEVSEVLGRYPGITEAIVYGVSLPNHEGKAGCAAISIVPTMRSNFDFIDLYRYAQKKLPKYAVPVFLRLSARMSHTHNNKQNKGPLKDEGVDPGKVNRDDKILWFNGSSLGYVPFSPEDWNRVNLAQVKL